VIKSPDLKFHHYPSDFTLSLVDFGVEDSSQRPYSSLTTIFKAGELVWIVGANGSGKSTLLRQLAGLGRYQGVAKNNAGAIINLLTHSWHNQVGYLGHIDGLLEHLTVAEIVELLENTQPSSSLLAEQIKLLGLNELYDLKVIDLSFGQRRRIALLEFATTVTKPIFILDEPFTGLDEDWIAVVQNMLASYCQRGGLLFVASHLVKPKVANYRQLEMK
jgi:heme exporter protein A